MDTDFCTAYSDGDFAFINAATDGKQTQELSHTFYFDRAITHLSFSDDDVKKKIREQGGILVYNDRWKSQFCCGSYYSCADYYIAQDFIALVYNGKNRDHLIIEAGLTSAKKVLPLFYLTPLSYLANDFYKALGTPPLSYCGVGSRLFTTLPVSTPSGLVADYYLFKGAQLEGAFGLKEQKVPWLYYPLTKAAARGVNAIFTKNCAYHTCLSQLDCHEPSFTSPATDNGVLFTSDAERGIAKTKSALQRAKDVVDLEWCRCVAKPSPANESLEAKMIFAVPSTKFVGDAVDGVLFYAYDGRRSYEVLQSYVDEAINSASGLLNGPSYLVTDEVSQLMSEALDLYNKTLADTWRNFALQRESEIKVFRDAYDIAVIDIPNKIMQAEFAPKITSHLSSFADGGALTKVTFSLPLLTSAPSALGSADSYASGVTNESERAGAYKRFCRDAYNLYGADSSPASPSIVFGRNSQATLEDSFRSQVFGPLETAVTKRVLDVLRVFENGTGVFENNVAHNHYIKFPFGDGVQDHEVYPESTIPNLASKMILRRLAINATGSQHAHIMMECEARFVDRIWWGCCERDWRNDMVALIRNKFTDDLSITLVGTGGTTFDHDKRFWPVTTDVKGFWGLPKLRQVKDKEMASWEPIPSVRFNVDFDVEVNLNWSPAAVPLDYNPDSILAVLEQEAQAAASRAFADFVVAHVDKLEELVQRQPFIAAEGFVVTPDMAKLFYAKPTATGEIFEEAISRLRASGIDMSEGSAGYRAEQLFTNLLQLYTSSCGLATAKPIYWTTEWLALSSPSSVWPNFAPLMIFFGGTNV